MRAPAITPCMDHGARCRSVVLICVLAGFGCSDSGAGGSAPAAGHAGDGQAGQQAVAGRAAQAGASGGDAESVVICNGKVCELPAIAAQTGLDVRTCCFNGACGVRVVGSEAITDLCLPWMPAGEPNADCVSVFDTTLFVYKYGCCLADNTCGELWYSAEQFGCGDPRALQRPAGAACDPAHTCGRLDGPCTDAAECCSFAPAGTACARFGGASGVCAPICEVDTDCRSLCCLPAQDGVKACAATERCNTPRP